MTEPATPLRVLLVEDSADDAELVLRTLREGGLVVEPRIVAADAGYRAQLAGFSPELILADWRIPGFSGAAAVAIAHEWNASVPCILVSGTLGEEIVVEALRTGATDYVLKQRLEGLVPAVRRALREAEELRARALLEAELLQSQRLEAVGQLAGGIAHDFNNLLTAIRGYSELLLRRLAADDAENRADLDAVIGAADRAATLTRQLLAFSRRQVLQPQVLDPAPIVEGIAPMLRRLLGEHIELSTHAAPGLERVSVDVGQFEQVVVNLAVNARDAMPAGGKLTIELANVELGEASLRVQFDPGPSPHVLLAVSDTGIGMDAATRTHIFEPFFTTKEEGHGTGMGLATVYGIVRQFGGSIDVDSEPGHGTTFRIYLPAVVGEATATVAPAITARPTPAGTETILLVEDQEAVLTFERRVLEHDGYAVLGAANGAEALSIAASHAGPIALLVTDVVMPGLQGNLLAEQLTADRPGLRVLFVSGFPDNAVGDHGVGEGEVAFLGKPFSAGALCTAVRAVLDEPAR